MIRLFVFTCLTLICSDVAALHFTIVPDVASDLADEIVDMNCSLGTQHVNVLYSIRIVKEGQSSPLATILTGDQTVVHDPSNSVAVNGHIDPVAPDTSYLHLRWSHPTFKNSGVYTCEITYLDLTEKTNSSNSKSVAELTVKKIDMHDIFRAILHVRDQTTERHEEIETLRKKNKKRDSQITFLHKSFTERDSQSKINSQLLKDMRETLNNVQRKSVERESITDATRKVLLENTNSLKGHDQRLDTLFDHLDNLTNTVNNLIDVVNNTCPDGSWKKFRSHCFKYIKSKKLWPKARDYCQSLDAHLPAIPDAPTNAFIFEMIKDTYYKPSVWIGLNDRAKEGSKVWDGSLLSYRRSSYKNWGFGHPKRDREVYYGTIHYYDYGVISGGNGKWAMDLTVNYNKFVCQKATVII